MEEPEGKASGFNSAVATLRQLVTPEAFQRVVAALPPETVELIEHPPLSLAWISTAHFRALVDAAVAQLFDGDESRLVEWGRRAVAHDLRTIYKVFIRFLSPRFVIERGARLWDTYQRNFGHAEAEVDGDNGCIVRYDGLPLAYTSPAFWAYQRGALHGVMDATGMKNVVVELVAGGGNTGHARFRVSWS